MLPYIVLRYANNALAHVHGYRGHVNSIGISLYRGAYQLDSFYLNKFDSATNTQTSLLSVQKVDLSIHWRALLHGRLVGNIEFYSPALLFKRNKTELGQVVKDTDDFRKVMRDFMPLKVNRFEVFNGSIHYIDNTTMPMVDFNMHDTYLLASNLRNTNDKKEKLPSSVTAKANAYGGLLTLQMKLDALSRIPTFILDAELKDADLSQMNDFFKAYGKFDVNSGKFGLYTECAAADNKFKGYVKPIITNLKVIGPQDSNSSMGHKVKEALVSVAAFILKNHRKEQIASKVPIEGRFDEPNVNKVEAVFELLRNAFIEALMPGVDNEIDLASAENAKVKPKK
jgi:hypothetical protein